MRGGERRRRSRARRRRPRARARRARAWKRRSSGPSSSMSPSTATRRPAGGRGEVVEGGAHRHRVGVVAVVDDDDAACESIRWPRIARERDLHGARPARRPTARAAASAASALRRMWAASNGTLDGRAGSSRDVAARAEGDGRDVRAQVRAPAAARPAGMTAVPPGAARRSAPPSPPRSPRSSRAARGGPGPTLTITPTSGSAIAASSAIWPAPRIAISSTSTSVPAGAPSTVSGRPISVLRFCGGRDDAPVRGEHPGEQVLGRGLAGRAGDPDDLRAERAAPGGREPAERGERVVGGEHAPPAGARGPRGVLGADEHAPRAGRERVRARSARRRGARRAARRTGRPGRPRASRSRAGRGPASGPRGRRARRAPARLGDAPSARPGAHAAPRGRRRRRRTGPCARPRTPGPARGPCRR